MTGRGWHLVESWVRYPWGMWNSLLPRVAIEVLRFLSEEIYSQQTQLGTLLLSTSWPSSGPYISLPYFSKCHLECAQPRRKLSNCVFNLSAAARGKLHIPRRGRLLGSAFASERIMTSVNLGSHRVDIPCSREFLTQSGVSLSVRE